jgi:RNA polymerase sigma-70 factor (ECF subfamily)
MSESTPTAPPDSELIARAQRGEIEAYGALYERYLDPIYRYIMMRVDQQSDAEDLCETVFLRTYEALDRYQEQGHPFSAYLYQVARNLLADYYRRREQDFDLEEVAERPEPGINPDLQLEQQEQIGEIALALGRLPEDYREVIRLRLVMELPTSTVAEWMDRSPGAVRVLLHRALISLRESLTEENA